MKKSLFVIILFISSYANSQVIEISGGLTKSRINDVAITNGIGDYLDGQELKFLIYPNPINSFNLSIGIEYFDRNYYSLKSSILYSKRGGHNPNNDSGFFPKHSFNERAEIDFISLNTLIRLKSPNKHFTPFLQIGPRLDYAINFNENFYGVDGKDEIRDDVETFFYGFDFGFGLYRNFLGCYYGIDFTKNFTFNNIFKANEFIDSKTASSMNVNLFISFNI